MAQKHPHPTPRHRLQAPSSESFRFCRESEDAARRFFFSGRLAFARLLPPRRLEEREAGAGDEAQLLAAFFFAFSFPMAKAATAPARATALQPRRPRTRAIAW